MVKGKLKCYWPKSNIGRFPTTTNYRDMNITCQETGFSDRPIMSVDNNTCPFSGRVLVLGQWWTEFIVLRMSTGILPGTTTGLLSISISRKTCS